MSVEHARLARLAGLWNVKQSLWLKPGEPPQMDTGTAEFTTVLGGRALQQDLRIDSSTPFQGMGVTGYDDATRTYFTSWMDVNFTGLLVLRGDRDESTNTWHFSGSMSGAGGTSIPTREELQVLDEDRFIVRYFEIRQGTENLVVQLEYSRR
ncbi:MAG: DUF1579 family protein [Asticcacaulis sp.]|nr:DUF1579 family protein [Asticcacaulis sp.]